MRIPAFVRPGRPFPGWITLAWLPMAFAVLGALLDERRHLGFSTWRSACRSAGLSASSLLIFTLELLPMAVIGALAGGLVLQAHAISARHERKTATASLAAHAGCSLGMMAGLPLCVLPVSVPLLLVAEMLLAALAAGLVQRLLSNRPSCDASGTLLIRGRRSA